MTEQRAEVRAVTELAARDGQPGWRLSGGGQEGGVWLAPPVDAGWGAVATDDGPALSLTPSGDAASTAHVRFDGALPGEIRVEARRAKDDWASLGRAGRRRAVLAQSVVASLAAFLLGVAAGVALTVATGRPSSVAVVPFTVVFVVAAATWPYRRALRTYTEFRLVAGGRPAGSWLTWPEGRRWQARQAPQGAGLEGVGIRVVPSWPADEAGVPATLIASPVDTGLLGFWSGDLWLLPDGLLFSPHGAMASFFSEYAGRAQQRTVRRFEPAELAALKAQRRARWVPWSDVASARLGTRLGRHHLQLVLASGRRQELLWRDGQVTAVPALITAAIAELGPRFLLPPQPTGQGRR